LRHVEVLVLDEADRMMDMGFIGEIRKVIAKLPTPHQTLFFSATMPTDIRKLANEILNNPVKIEVTPVSSTTDLVEQQVFFVEKMNKRALLLHILETTPTERVLVFTRSKARADMLVRFLNAANIKTDAIHSNKSQNARQRALQDFRVGKTAVLVATDIASRGLDVDGISHVVNYDLPNEPETYVHRIGRTGRAGATGIAMSFCDTEELYYLADIEQVIKQQIPQAPEHPYNMHDHTVAPSAAMPPAPKPFRTPSGPRPNPRNGGGGSNNNGSRPRRPVSGGGHSLSAVTKSRRTDAAAPKKTALPVGQA
ncbi:MAG: DEAD/DEAH box helicase, partial [Cyanobacteria bacterium]|nr:DEAD/DEAH box helicase [Cyanobacteriota bacterium]